MRWVLFMLISSRTILSLYNCECSFSVHECACARRPPLHEPRLPGAGAYAPPLRLVDWGRAIDTAHPLMPDNVEFAGTSGTSSFECTQMRDGQPWTYQTDTFGLLATVHVMLFGTYMNCVREGGGTRRGGGGSTSATHTGWTMTSTFKRCVRASTMGTPRMRMYYRQWNTSLWKSFTRDILNVPSCREQVDMDAYYKRFADYFNEQLIEEAAKWRQQVDAITAALSK